MNRVPGTLKKDISDVASSLHWVKLIGVGDVGTGKTCLIKYFCESQFTPAYQATVGVDYGFKIQSVQNWDLRVHIWDFSGNLDYFEVRNELYGETDGVFVVFDVCNAASFNSIESWLKEIRMQTQGNLPEVILVGNKVDAEDRRVIQAAEARKLAHRLKLTYVETSAASGENVIKMFNEILEKVVAKKNIAWQTKVLQRPS